MRSCIPILVLLWSVSISATVVQTDWGGGAGVPGPVSSWGTKFFTSSDIDFTGGSLRLYEGERYTVSSDFAGAISVFCFDMDADGDIDLLGAASGSEEVIWWENLDGSGKQWTEHLVNGSYTGVKAVHAADIDGDGDQDILGAASTLYGFRDVTWWENTDGAGSSWSERPVAGSFYGARSVFSADVDGDGDLDVLAASAYLDDISWWENKDGSGGGWEKHTITDLFNGAAGVIAVDVDGDGDQDVVGSAIYADDVTWWENETGSGIGWTEHPVDLDFNCPVSLFAADLDGDNDMDLVGAAALADDVTWWENRNGSGDSWIKHPIDGEFDAAYSVFAADMDGDDDLDVLGAAYLADDVTWWENLNGSGTAWTEHSVNGDFDGAASIQAADINGDGDNDIIAVAHFEDEITWWDILGYGSGGILESSILDAGDVGRWRIFFSTSQEPEGTSVGFQFRSSSDCSDMGPWSETVYTPDTPLGEILADSTRYLQYRAILETDDPGVSPELGEVAFGYSLVGTGESGSCQADLWSFRALENPCRGSLTVLVSVPQDGPVELSVYDVSGRLAADAAEEFTSGTHSVVFNGLPRGVYICSMRAGDHTCTEKAVILE